MIIKETLDNLVSIKNEAQFEIFCQTNAQYEAAGLLSQT